MNILKDNKKKILWIFFLGAFLGILVPNFYAQGFHMYPRINKLQHTDPVFLQFCDDVALARKAIAQNKENYVFLFQIYVYKVQKNDSILSIAARCSIPYDSLITLNRISSLEQQITGKDLLIPSFPGLYIPDIPKSDFEILVLSSVQYQTEQFFDFRIRNSEGLLETIHCFPGMLLDGTTRTFFLTPSFVFPLPQGIVTSRFGMRKNPITGNLIFHKGIDLAAPIGTPVFACAAGTVVDSGFDAVYGNYVVLNHTNNKTSLYGHLESIKIELRQKVKSGTILGTVGSTGQSTGSHLHFEIHENGQPKNPFGFIKEKY